MWHYYMLAVGARAGLGDTPRAAGVGGSMRSGPGGPGGPGGGAAGAGGPEAAGGHLPGGAGPGPAPLEPLAPAAPAPHGSLPNLHELKKERYAGDLGLEPDDKDQQGRPWHATDGTKEAARVAGDAQQPQPGPLPGPHRPLAATLSDGPTRSYRVRPTVATAAMLADYYQGQSCGGGLVFSPLAARSLRCPHSAQQQPHHSRGPSHGGHWDDVNVEHAYSPQRSGTAQGGALPGRKRDSLTSSTGTSSVRRLIAVVRSTPSRLGPVYTRRTLCRSYAALCLGHTMFIVALMPLVALQGSVSAWWWTWSYPGDPNNDSGALLLIAFFGAAGLSATVSPSVVSRLTANWTLILGYLGIALFLAAHLYPTFEVLLPTYLLGGLCLGPLAVARVTVLMALSSKLALQLTEQEEMDADAEELEAVMAGAGGGGRIETVLRRLARGLQFAHDAGLALGSVIASLLLWYTLPEAGALWDAVWTAGPSGLSFGGLADANLTGAASSLPATALLEAYWPLGEDGGRICGAQACPISADPDDWEDLARPRTLAQFLVFNVTAWNGKLVRLPCKTTAVLASVFLGCAIMGLALTAVFLDHLRGTGQHHDACGGGLQERPPSHLRAVWDSFKDARMQLIIPLSIFIGLEQGFMLADFSKWYVVCSLGLHNVCLVFMSMGLMQSVAAFTLSMLLQHIRRYVVIGVGFTFHTCLIMVLLTWLPSAEDSALFYVISAAWGVCNAIWETLSFSLLVRVYPDSWQGPVSLSNMWRFLGLSLSFLMHASACNSFKLYALFAALVLAVTPYALLESSAGAPMPALPRLNRLGRPRCPPCMRPTSSRAGSGRQPAVHQPPPPPQPPQPQHNGRVPSCGPAVLDPSRLEDAPAAPTPSATTARAALAPPAPPPPDAPETFVLETKSVSQATAAPQDAQRASPTETDARETGAPAAAALPRASPPTSASSRRASPEDRAAAGPAGPEAAAVRHGDEGERVEQDTDASPS
ncbi:UNC93-like protein [Frankliniella fusca]|uniref:UNC93-like protein n=1 Tax=Frankliniella fusca TaxID=407009 RepID=A0AAE1HE63_9NEOP|nr:UNC93-like protein [Frankliniella fusca]